MQNSIYNFIQQNQEDLEKTLEVRFIKKKTKKTKDKQKRHYFLIAFPLVKEVFLINQLSYEIIEHHCSIDQERSQHEQDKRSAYHYTITVQEKNGTLLTIHVYFDATGQCIAIQAKNQQGHVYELSAASQLEIYKLAKRIAGPLISNLINECHKLVTTLNEVYRKKYALLLKVSALIGTIENVFDAKKNHLLYYKNLQECLTILEKLNLYTDNQERSVINALRNLEKKIHLIQFEKINSQDVLTPHDDFIDESLCEKEISTHLFKPKKNDLHINETKIVALNSEIKKCEDTKDTFNILKKYKHLKEKFNVAEDDMLVLTTAQELLAHEFLLQESLNTILKSNELVDDKKFSEVLLLCSACDKLEIPFDYYHILITLGNVKTLTFLITKYKINLDHYSINNGGQTLLLHAIQCEQYDIALLLLKQKANPDMPNKITGTLPLFLAIEICNKKNLTLGISFVQILLEHNANPNLKIRPPIFVCMINNKIVSVLKTTEDSFVEKFDPTAFIFAALSQKLNLVQCFLQYSKISIDFSIKNKEGFTAIGFLCSKTFGLNIDYQKAIFKLLLEKNCNIDEPQAENKSCLFLCCEYEQAELIKLLVTLGADPNKKTRCESVLFGYSFFVDVTPFVRAVSKGNVEIVTYLLNQTNTPITAENLNRGLTICKRPDREIKILIIQKLESLKDEKLVNDPLENSVQMKF